MKLAITAAVLLALGGAAQAKLTPFDGTREAKPAETPTDVVSLYTEPAAAALERSYFTAPQSTGVAERPGRCTVSSFVFAKVTLAQACY
ncbi:hypothetical protein [Undibacter mobilis]|uniref:Uncharacterized protein n=1 Tax=Undibacter mobilis TaxID=2292256 RepID=A0A371BCC2_9BRAD|nr:hypothetical protein [Undibacter mobilis]RDV05208.1 hypothetical protein DXH78_11900 [Undibacter mobilis]